MSTSRQRDEAPASDSAPKPEEKPASGGFTGYLASWWAGKPEKKEEEKQDQRESHHSQNRGKSGYQGEQPPRGHYDPRYGAPPPGHYDPRYGAPPPGHYDPRYGGPPPPGYYYDPRYGAPPPPAQYYDPRYGAPPPAQYYDPRYGAPPPPGPPGNPYAAEIEARIAEEREREMAVGEVDHDPRCRDAWNRGDNEHENEHAYGQRRYEPDMRYFPEGHSAPREGPGVDENGQPRDTPQTAANNPFVYAQELFSAVQHEWFGAPREKDVVYKDDAQAGEQRKDSTKYEGQPMPKAEKAAQKKVEPQEDDDYQRLQGDDVDEKSVNESDNEMPVNPERKITASIPTR